MKSTPIMQWLDTVAALAFAGLLWVVASLPLVTLAPATAALFGVTTSWTDGPPAIWSTYWSSFRRHFRQSMAFGALVFVAVVVVTVDAAFALRAADAPLRVLVLAVAILGGLAVAGVLVFLFTVMISYPAKWTSVLRNSALLAAACPGTTLLGLVVMAVATLATYSVPVLLPFTAGLAAFAVTKLTTRAVARVSIRQQRRRVSSSSR